MAPGCKRYFRKSRASCETGKALMAGIAGACLKNVQSNGGAAVRPLPFAKPAITHKLMHKICE